MSTQRVYFQVSGDTAPVTEKLDRVFAEPDLAPGSLELVFDVAGAENLGVDTALKFRNAVEPYRGRCAKFCNRHVIRTSNRITQLLVRGALTFFKPVVETVVTISPRQAATDRPQKSSETEVTQIGS